MLKNFKKNLRGFSLVEVILALAIFGILSAGVFQVVTNSYGTFYGSGDKQVVAQFTQEGIEAVRSIRDNSWQDIENVVGTGNKGLAKNTNSYWQFSGTSNTNGSLTRVVGVMKAYRDASGNIVDTGGTEDPNTFRVTATTTASGMADYVLTTYLTNWTYKTWSQTDWSGVGARDFWSDATMASSDYSNITTSTVGELTLSRVLGTQMSWSAWADVTPDESAKNKAWEDFYDMYLGPDGKSLYVIGTTNYDFVKYDISRAQSGIVRPEWKIQVPWHIQSMALNPNGSYAYMGRRLPTDSNDTICVARIATLSVDTVNDCYDLTYPGATWYIISMVVNAAGDRLYVFDNYGYAYVFAISGGGATLTLLSDTRQLLTSAAGTAYAINQVYLDESGANPYIYLVTDDNSGEFRKMGFDSDKMWFSSTSTYAFVDSSPTIDYNDIELLEVSSGKNRFILGTENSSAEFMIVEDQGTSLSTIGSYNVPTSPGFAEVTSDRQNMAFVHYYYNPSSVYAIDITNRAGPVDGGMSNTTFYQRSNYIDYDQMLYSTTSHGFFVSDHRVTTNLVDLHFIGRDFTRATGGTFDYRRPITLGLGGTVSSGPHTDFPIAISETQGYLKSVSNGGKVYSADGYDIIFTSDAAGTTVLDHEIETYNPSTGELVAWVRIPSLATNTTIYMFYGNANITSTQEHVDGVWSGGYQIVSHMNDSGTGGVGTSVSGSTGWFKYGVNAPAQSDGKIGRGQGFDGSYDYLTVEHSEDKDQTTNDFTVEFWIKPSSTYVSTVNGVLFFGNGDVGDQDGWIFAYYPGSTKKLLFHMGDSVGGVETNNLGGMYTNDALTSNVWTHVAVVVDRSAGYQYYIDTAADSSYAIDSSPYSVGELSDVAIGRHWALTDYFFKGELDELRVSLTTRTQGWVTTGYNNMNSTSTFYSIGSESPAIAYNSPGYLYSSIFDLGSTDKELRSMSVEQNVPSGCNATITIEGSNVADFSSVTSEDFSDDGATYYTSSTPATLNGNRYIRYKATLTACNSNTETPTLYSVKFNYR